MQFAKIMAVPLGLAALLTACGGPSQDQIERSIVENYEQNGYEDIEVTLEPTDDGGYTGEVAFTVPDGRIRRNLACTVEPPEGTEASWRCEPRIEDLERVVIEGYAQRGAAQVSADLERVNDTRYTGYVEYTDPRSGQRFRHNCAVELVDGDANWQCAP